MSHETASPLVLTIGHSTHPIDAFIGLLQAHGAVCLMDVRTVPRSRHNPQFNQEALAQSLADAGLGYVHAPGLGGLRRARPDSPNAGWRNASFRGYADYMQTADFARSLDALIALAQTRRIVLMCAEAVPWRCHRSLIADALILRGFRVEHILSATRRQVHTLTSFARVSGGTLTYPPEAVSAPTQAPGTADGCCTDEGGSTHIENTDSKSQKRSFVK